MNMMYRVSPAPLRADENIIATASKSEKTAMKRSATIAIGRMSAKVFPSACDAKGLRKMSGANTKSVDAVAI